MHRHGYKGRKFGRQSDQRRALLAGLANSLVLQESVVTTLPKAKETVSYTEVLITKAKKSGLHNRRQVLAGLTTVEAAHRLVDDIAPRLDGRSSGHLRIKKTITRRSDGAQMAKITFVDDLTAKKPLKKADKTSTSTPKKMVKKAPVSKSAGKDKG